MFCVNTCHNQTWDRFILKEGDNLIFTKPISHWFAQLDASHQIVQANRVQNVVPFLRR